MDTLPAEIFKSVVALLPPLGLLSLRLVNKTYNLWFTPPAFRSVRFRNTYTSMWRFHLVSSVPEIYPHVHELCFILDDSNLLVDGEVPAQYKWPNRLSGGSDQIIGFPHGHLFLKPLKNFTSLRRVSVTLPGTENIFNRDGYYTYRLRMQKVFLRGIIQQLNSPTLNSLHVKNLYIVPLTPFLSDNIARFRDRITELDLDIDYMPPIQPDHGLHVRMPTDRWDEELWQTWVGPMEPKLQKWVVGCTGRWVRSVMLRRTCTFPELRSLTINGMVVDTSSSEKDQLVPIWSFLVGNMGSGFAQRLQHLRLVKCSTVGFYWSSIFEMMEGSLQNLKRCEMESLEYSGFDEALLKMDLEALHGWWGRKGIVGFVDGVQVETS